MRILVYISSAVLSATTISHAADAKPNFAKDIQPILQDRCVKCHGPEKQKAKLRLDSKEAALKGGGDEPIIVPGKADGSELFRRISLAKGHDDIMPPEGDPLTPAQINAIRDWINQGAAWSEAAPAPKPVQAAAPAPTKGPTLPKDFKPEPAEAQAIAKLAQAGVDARTVAAGVPWREANFRLQGTNINDASLPVLKDLRSLVELNLAGTKITDAGLTHLQGLSHLQRLHLQLTAVTDAGLVHLKALTNLTYLNLYGTQVSDAGLEHVKALPHLKSIYLWQTKVTDAGAASLKQALPHLEISRGLDLKTMAKAEPPAKPEAKK